MKELLVSTNLSFSYRSISHYTAIDIKNVCRQCSKQHVRTDKVNWKANEKDRFMYSYLYWIINIHSRRPDFSYSKSAEIVKLLVSDVTRH